MHLGTPAYTGVIEGFFGRPWDGWARVSTVPFLHHTGCHFYIYAPKANDFLRRRFREPMPQEMLEHLAHLGALCRKNGLDFGVGLSPLEIYLDYDTHARELLRAKVRQLNETGAQILAILFDDMRGDVPGLAALQARVIADICDASHARRFIVAPTYYSSDERLTREFGAAPEGYLQDLGRAVDSRVDFFWTGEKVISDSYPAAHLAQVAEDMGRKPFLWDNHMANDSRLRTHHLFLSPAETRWELAAGHVAGVAFNPMNQPYLSRIALRGYRHLLTGGARGPHVLAGICRDLCGPAFAQALLADRELWGRGLQALDAPTRDRLAAQYGGDAANPYAQDIAAWLRGEYEFDPACLTA